MIFGERGVWIKPRLSNSETLKSVQVHQLTVNPSGGKSYSTRQFAPFGLMESAGQTRIPEILWDSSPAMLLGPRQLAGTRTGTWPLRLRCANKLRWGSGSADTRQALLLAVPQLGALQAPAPHLFPLLTSPLRTPGLPLLPPPLPACGLG